MREWTSLDEAYQCAVKYFIFYNKDISSIQAREALDYCIAEKDHNAQYLAYLIEYGEKAKNGRQLSLDNLRAAAESGMPEAQYDLALHLFYGELVEKDIDQALALMEMAASQGYMEACRTLVRFYSFDSRVEEDSERAKYWKDKLKDGLIVNQDMRIPLGEKIAKSDNLGEKLEKDKTQELKENTKTDISIKNDIINEKQEIDKKTKEEYDKNIKTKISGSYMLDDVSNELFHTLFGNKTVLFVAANESELAYVSGTLLRLGIDHVTDIKEGENLLFVHNGKSIEVSDTDIILVTSNFVQQGYDYKTMVIWEKLLRAKSLAELSVPDIEFFSFDTSSETRWGCRNIQGALYLVVRMEDLNLFDDSVREQKITLMKDTHNYIILSSSSAEQLGVTNSSLWSALESMKKVGEISDLPRVISGLHISKSKGEIELKGIGHMKLETY